jgi:hypothetical protein
MSQKKSIEWEVYRSPLEDNDEDEIEDVTPYDDGYHDEISIENMPKFKHPGKHIYTHFGIIPLPSNEDLQNNFNLFVMHTNFNINEEVKNKVETVDGVEIVHLFSRYRALIGIGKHSSFNSVQVRLDINKTLCGSETNTITIEDKVVALKNKLETAKRLNKKLNGLLYDSKTTDNS